MTEYYALFAMTPSRLDFVASSRFRHEAGIDPHPATP
jgi:hypothetical protein